MYLTSSCSLFSDHKTTSSSNATLDERLAWTNHSTVYQIFPRSFKDSNGDGIGDIAGITQKLDLLNDGNPSTNNDLGIEAIWLTPIFSSPSYHGYDTTDYRAINPDYGTMNDFEELITQAHKRGIRIILDFVLNHTSSKHPWFIEARSDKSSSYRDWYVWDTTNPGWTQPWSIYPAWYFDKLSNSYYYGVFWEGMPDLNYKNPEVLTYFKETAQFWLDKGVDGFRLDAIPYLAEEGKNKQKGQQKTHDILQEFAAFVKAYKPEAILVGEVWTYDYKDLDSYFGIIEQNRKFGDEIPFNFNFPFQASTIDALKKQNVYELPKEIKHIFSSEFSYANFIENHDMNRSATTLSNDLAKEKLAAFFLFTLPGLPFVYYGQELGMLNGPGSDDKEKRAPYLWDHSAYNGFSTTKPWHPPVVGNISPHSFQSQDDGSLLKTYSKLIKYRKKLPLQNISSYSLKDTTDTSEVIQWQIEGNEEKWLFLVNLSGKEQDILCQENQDWQLELKIGGFTQKNNHSCNQLHAFSAVILKN